LSPSGGLGFLGGPKAEPTLLQGIAEGETQQENQGERDHEDKGQREIATEEAAALGCKDAEARGHSHAIPGRHAGRIVSGFRSDYHLKTPATQNGSTVYSFPFLRTTVEEGQGRPIVMLA